MLIKYSFKESKYFFGCKVGETKRSDPDDVSRLPEKRNRDFVLSTIMGVVRRHDVITTGCVGLHFLAHTKHYLSILAMGCSNNM